jgi:hypothetical protein
MWVFWYWQEMGSVVLPLEGNSTACEDGRPLLTAKCKGLGNWSPTVNIRVCWEAKPQAYD